MSERDRNYFGRAQRARQIRFSVMTRGVRFIHEREAVIGTEDATILSGELIRLWAEGEITNIVSDTLGRIDERTVFDADSEE